MSLIGTLHRRLLLVRRGDGCARTASVARDGWRGGLAGRGADVARSAGPFAPALFVYRAALFGARSCRSHVNSVEPSSGRRNSCDR